jgi:CheY-like chemotaxis protein
MDITLNTSMTGIDAAREITKVSNIPIVFLTGNTDSSILDSGREISTNEVVAKTFDDEELHVAIQQSIISNAMNSEFKKNADK